MSINLIHKRSQQAAPETFENSKPVSKWDHRLDRTQIFMTARDVQMTDVAKTANALHGTTPRPSRPRTGLYRNMFKRALDVSLVVLSLPIILPLIAALALFVAREGGKPFYGQKRVGRNGRTFHMWKLRSMVHNADNVLETYLFENPDMRDEWNTKQKLRNDPRVTRMGQFLRKSSIDELPQLFNVLTGDMSLVGPRPMMVGQQELYPGRDYFDMRPGITGLWQITDRNESSFAARAFYDARYNRRLSFTTDISILLSTVRVVLRGTGC